MGKKSNTKSAHIQSQPVLNDNQRKGLNRQKREELSKLVDEILKSKYKFNLRPSFTNY